MIERNGGKRAVITGASSGIGAATALAFAAEGWQLMLAARGASGLEDIAARCRAAGGEAHVHVGDLTDAAQSAALAAAARETLGGIDLWFSDVGVGVLGLFHEVPIDLHRRVIEANLISHMNDAHAVLPVFFAQGHGTFVNMISVAAFAATPQSAAYSASKYGLRGFSHALRAELSKQPRIHVCDVFPIFVDTPAVDHAGNFTGKQASLPPGALAPATVAAKVVRLARHPRNSTFVGAPGIAFRLVDAVVPNLAPAVLNGFLDVWRRTDPKVGDTAGSLVDAPGTADGVDGGRRSPRARRIGVAAAAALALAGLGAAVAFRAGR